MDEREEPKPPKINLKRRNSRLSEINLDDIKRDPTLHVSPRAPGIMLTKPSSGRWNCLCSPTTHAGSFRCRHHRVSGLMRGGSVGSNLSLLGQSKSEPIITDSLQAE